MMLLSNLKARFYTYQSKRVGRGRLGKDTTQVLYGPTLEEATHTGVGHSYVEPPVTKTMNRYHSTLVSVLDTGQRTDVF
jgi:hypothetical protein